MYRTVADIFTDTAEAWPDSDEQLAKIAASLGASSNNHRPYIDLVDPLLQRLEQSSDARVVDLSKNYNTVLGIGEIARFYCHQFQSAAANGIQLERAGQAMASAIDQVHPLSALASYPNEVARQYEDMLGLKKDSFCYADGQRDSLSLWRQGNLSYSQHLERALQSTYRDILRSPPRSERPFNPHGMCPAKKADKLGVITHAVLNICLKDVSLAQRTYDLGITRCR